MNEASRETLDTYYKEAGSWTEDRQKASQKSLRLAWRIAGAAVVVAVLEAFALILLAPLKTVVPYTILVDRQTGYVQALDPVSPRRVSADSALTQSFLVQYVAAREGFDADLVQSAYRKVALWSAERARADYVAAMQGTNPESPLRIYPRGTVIETNVKSVSALGDNIALVRFETVRRDNGGPPTLIGNWASVVRYRYSTAPLSAEDRFVNPLGFQVVAYRRDAEALPSTAAPVPAAQPVQVGPPAAAIIAPPNGPPDIPEPGSAPKAEPRQ
jgi:type IV secretion system protein VirB8